MCADDGDVAELAGAARRLLREQFERWRLRLPVSDEVTRFLDDLDAALRAPLTEAAGGDGRVTPHDVPALADGASGDAAPWAAANVLKRLDELTGALFALRQAAARAERDPARLPVAVERADDHARRLAAALATWHGDAPPPPDPRNFLTAARACLDAGALRAAAQAAQAALVAALAARSVAVADLDEGLVAWRAAHLETPGGDRAWQALDAALARAPSDPVVAARLVDATAALVDAAHVARGPSVGPTPQK